MNLQTILVLLPPVARVFKELLDLARNPKVAMIEGDPIVEGFSLAKRGFKVLGKTILAAKLITSATATQRDNLVLEKGLEGLKQLRDNLNALIEQVEK